MKKFVLVLLNVLLIMVMEIPLVYPQGAPMPFRIGGTVTMDGVQITQATDEGLLIRVTKPDGTNYEDIAGNVPEDKDGLNANNWYLINIPIYKSSIQPKGANPGEMPFIQVYKNSQELRITDPPAGEMTIGNEGTVSRIDLTVTTTAETVNLKPYKPQEWSDAIVVSKETETTTDSSALYTTDTLYLDWAVINKSSVDITTGFYVSLFVDGMFKNSWYSDSLKANYYRFVKDFPIGQLGAGSHNLTIVADSDQRVNEGSEADNEYTRTITVLSEGPSSDLPNLRPYQPKDWPDAVVVSTSPGTYMDSGLYTGEDDLYVSWAVLNDGPVNTSGGFSVDLYIDGVFEKSWSYSAPLKSNYYRSAKDYPIGKLSGGYHMIEIVVDPDQVISEGDEEDNVYFKEIWVEGILFYQGLPNLTPYQPPGWPDKIVVSSLRSPGGGPFTPKEILLVDWAVTNNGEVGMSKWASVSLYVDGMLKKNWKIPRLRANDHYAFWNSPIGPLDVGDHTLTLVLDPEAQVSEGNEGDNEYHKTIRIVGTP